VARCEIKAKGNGTEGLIAIDIAGSSSGAKVSWSRTDGQAGQLEGVGPTWRLPWVCPDSCKNDYTFTVQVEGVKECTRSARVGRVFPERPRVTLTVSPFETRTCRPFEKIEATAGSPCFESLVTTLHGGRGKSLPHYDEALKKPSVAGFALCKPGFYSFLSVGTDLCGQTAIGEVQILVKPRWTARGTGVWLDSKADAVRTERTLPAAGVETTSFELGQGIGLGASAEYHQSDRVGIEAGLVVGRVDSRFRKGLGGVVALQEQEKGLQFTALSLGPTFHLLGKPPGQADLHLGVFASWWNFEGKTYSPLGSSDRRRHGSEIGYGVRLGCDLPFKRSIQWALSIGARYEKLSPEVDLGALGKRGIEVDPLSLSAGVAYSF
jgi:outer membrane protein W